MTTLRDVLEQEGAEYFWVKFDDGWDIGHVGEFGIFETMTDGCLDYLDYADCLAIKIEKPTE